MSEERLGQRTLSGSLNVVVTILCTLLSVYIFFYALTVFDFLGLSLYGAHRALAFSIIGILIFLIYPCHKRLSGRGIFWFDWVAMLGISLPSIYAFIYWEDWLYGINMPTLIEELLALVFILSILEASRRALGAAFTIVASIFILYPIVGAYLPGILQTNTYSVSQLTQFFYLSGGGSGVFGIPMEIFTTTVATFLIFGVFLQNIGRSEHFISIAKSLTGSARGGMAKVAVISSAFFSTISGVGVANVLITGTMTIPAMKRSGFKAPFAAAVEATASTGGVLMPPVMGSAAFLMADIVGVPYWDIVVAAFLPAILFYLAMYFVVDGEAAHSRISGVDDEIIPSFLKSLTDGWLLLMPICLLMMLIGYFSIPVDQSAALTISFLILMRIFMGRGRLSTVRESFQESGRLIAQLGVAGAVLGIIMGGFSLTGLGAFIPTMLASLAGDNLVLLLILAAVASIVLGMGAPPLLVYVLLAGTVAPTLISLGVKPLSAHLFIFYFGMLSLITPPVALSVLVASRIAEADFWDASIQAVKLGLVAFIIPFCFVLEPRLLLLEVDLSSLWIFSTTVLGIYSISSALTGFSIRHSIALVPRVGYGLAGFLMIFPEGHSDIFGILLWVAISGYTRSWLKTTNVK